MTPHHPADTANTTRRRLQEQTQMYYLSLAGSLKLISPLPSVTILGGKGFVIFRLSLLLGAVIITIKIIIAKRFNITQMLQYNNNHNNSHNSNARQWRGLFFSFFFLWRGHFLIVRHLANDKYIVILGVELADKYNENVMTFFFFLTSSARLKKKE